MVKHGRRWPSPLPCDTCSSPPRCLWKLHCHAHRGGHHSPSRAEMFLWGAIFPPCHLLGLGLLWSRGDGARQENKPRALEQCQEWMSLLITYFFFMHLFSYFNLLIYSHFISCSLYASKAQHWPCVLGASAAGHTGTRSKLMYLLLLEDRGSSTWQPCMAQLNFHDFPQHDLKYSPVSLGCVEKPLEISLLLPHTEPSRISWGFVFLLLVYLLDFVSFPVNFERKSFKKSPGKHVSSTKLSGACPA